MHIGLFFGSFNPIHTGHLIVANHIAEHADIDKLWFVVSPHNPLKDSNSLLNEYDRLHLVRLAIEDNSKFRASNIEFQLAKPSYTIDTLTYLAEKFPLESFSIIMGSDSFQNIHRWKNYEHLLENYPIIIYKRPGFEIEDTHGANITIMDAPMLSISATFIRKQVQQGKSIQYLVHDKVWQYIEESNYYK